MIRTRHAWTIAAAGVLALGSASPRAAAEAEPAAATIADAVRFRTDFGLRSDVEFVRSTLDSDTFDASDWGVPLSLEELRDLADRTVAREAMSDAIEFANAQTNGSGVYIDQHRQGRIVFLTTTPDDLANGLAPLIPDGANYEIRRASRSLSDLEDVQDRIIEKMPELDARGLAIRSIGIDITNNVVRVGTAGASDRVAEALADMGPANTFQYYEQPSIHPDTCSSMAYCWPLKGGDRVYLVSDSVRSCTSGFIAKTTATGAYVDLTAGHCLELNNSSGTDYWGHAASPTAAANFGAERAETFYDYSAGDIGLLTLNSTTISAIAGAKNAIHVSDPSSNDVVDFVRANTNQIVGDSVCRMGWGTYHYKPGAMDVQGLTCGTITVFNTTNLSDDDASGNHIHIQHTNEVSFDSIMGDSGGPVWHKVFTPEPLLYAYGTHVHSDPDTDPNAIGWYTPIDQGRSAYNTLFGSSYTICLTANC